MNSKRYTQITLCLIAIIFSTTRIIFARSVYVISDTEASEMRAYKVEDANLVYQIDYDFVSETWGPVGIAIHESDYGQFLFITFEKTKEIELVNAKTMQYVDVVTAPGATNLAGIAMGKNKLYSVDRWTNHLYSYSWNPATMTLTPDFDYPYYVELQDIEIGGGKGAFGIALDEENGRLYVADNTTTVKCYDANDPNWSKLDDFTFTVTDEAIGIAVDVDNGYVYTGNGNPFGSTKLSQYDLSADPNTAETTVDVGSPVLGIAVDQQTGLIYLTTYGGPTGEIYQNPPHDRLMIYDSNLTKQEWESGDIGNPAGVAVGSTAAYKPPFPLVVLVKDDNDVTCVLPQISEAEHDWIGSPYNWLYYNIEYDANGHADTNVVITDYLPVEVNYISSDPCGYYDPDRRTVTWNIPIMSASDSNTFRIQVAVNYYAKPGHKIINLCEIESDQYLSYAIEDTNVCCYGGDVIYVNQDANGYNNGTSWQDAYKDLQDALHTARICGCNQIWVAEGTYIPIDTYISNESARSISFEMVDDVAVYGGFPNSGDPNFSDRDWQIYITTLSGDIRKPDDQSDNSYHVVHCNDVNNATLDGFTITGGKANGSGNDYGGGIYCQASTFTNLTLTDCNVSENTAYYGGGMYNKYSPANVTNLSFIGNTGYYGGAGMWNYQASPKVANCTFTSNKSTSERTDGGGMYNDQSSPTIINCTFSGNSVPAYGDGGAIFNTNSSDPNISNCAFSNNSSTEGGAVYNNYSKPNITNCIFTDNSADNGGAVYNYYSDPNITDCVFAANNVTYGIGGGMYNYQASPKVVNCLFSDNESSKYNGGGMYNYQSSPAITYCIFSGNKANSDGGGISDCNSSPTLTNCIFTGNIANSYGGGMHNKDNSSVAVANCIFSGNISGLGGAINNDNSDVSVTNCTVAGNAAWDGGGIHNTYYSYVDVTNCIFWNNVFDEICNDSNTCSLYVNYSDVNEGWLGTGNINEDPCFFTVNSPTGSWTENASYDSSTYQSTLTNANANWVVNQLAGKFVNPDTPNQYLQFFIVSNDVNTIKVWSDVESIALTGKTYQIYDYHLTADSNCIDAGDPDFNPDPNMTDIDGERRVVDGDANGTKIVDMGADEYYRSPADFNSDGIVNFFDYALFANFWQKTSDVYDLIDDNNYIDYNDLARFCEDWLWQRAWAKAFPFSYGQGMGKSMGLGMSEGLGLAEEILPSASAKKPQPQVTKADIEEIIKWLEELWLTDAEVRKMISEDEWLKFMESVYRR